MKHLPLIILIAILLPSCVTKRACERKFPPRVETITNTVTIVKDSIITITLPGDTVHSRDTVYIGSDGLVNSRIVENDTEYCYSFARVLNGILITELRQKESEIKKLIEGAVKIVTVEKEVSRIVEVNRLKWWQTALMWMGGALILIVVYHIFRPK
jgi:hypothetical protein